MQLGPRVPFELALKQEMLGEGGDFAALGRISPHLRPR
jgi:hypothetical protein